MLTIQDRFGNTIEKGAFVSFISGSSHPSTELGLVEQVYIKDGWEYPWDKWRVRIKQLNMKTKRS